MKPFLLPSLALAASLGACASKPPEAAAPDGTNAPAAAAAPAWVAEVKAGAPLIDVRSQGEWDDGHIDGASLIPVDQFEGRIAEVEAMVAGDKSKPVVLHCRSGARSGRAKVMLERAGFTNVRNAGGYEDVREHLAAGK